MMYRYNCTCYVDQWEAFQTKSHIVHKQDNKTDYPSLSFHKLTKAKMVIQTRPFHFPLHSLPHQRGVTNLHFYRSSFLLLFIYVILIVVDDLPHLEVVVFHFFGSFHTCFDHFMLD